jgi:hypothetical protein
VLRSDVFGFTFYFVSIAELIESCSLSLGFLYCLVSVPGRVSPTRTLGLIVNQKDADIVQRFIPEQLSAAGTPSRNLI